MIKLILSTVIILKIGYLISISLFIQQQYLILVNLRLVVYIRAFYE